MAVSCANPWAFGCVLTDCDPMSQRYTLELQCEPRAKQGGHKRDQRTNKRSHGSGFSLAGLGPTTKDSKLMPLTKEVKNIK